MRELGQQEALQETDRGAYCPASATPREPSLNQWGKLIPRDDDKLVHVREELRETANGHAAELKIVSIPDDVQRVMTKTDGHDRYAKCTARGKEEAMTVGAKQDREDGLV